MTRVRYVLSLAALASALPGQAAVGGWVGFRQACLDATTDALVLNIAAHPDDANRMVVRADFAAEPPGGECVDNGSGGFACLGGSFDVLGGDFGGVLRAALSLFGVALLTLGVTAPKTFFEVPMAPYKTMSAKLRSDDVGIAHEQTSHAGEPDRRRLS